MFHGCFKDVSKKLEWHFQSDLKGFEKLVSEVFQASFRVVSGNIQGCVKSISKIPPGVQKCFQLYSMFKYGIEMRGIYRFKI